MSGDISLTRLRTEQRPQIEEMLRATKEFSADEVAVALELVDAALAGSSDYLFLVAQSREHTVRGYICYGPTPMTDSTFDLYWIVVDPAHKGGGIGKRLISGMEEELTSRGARLVRVETEGSPEYDATRSFYERIGYEVLAKIRDFYQRGNALIIYGRYFNG